MKTKKWYMIFVMIFIASSVMAQNGAFGDDIYYSSKNKKTEETKPKAEPVKKVREAPVVVEATVQSERNVDEYNRRYINDKEYIDEAVDENDTIVEYVDGQLTQRIVKFHDPSKVIITGADNVNIYYDGENYELNFDEPSSTGLSININSGYGYNPWYTGWYSPWNYGYGWYSPWRYSYGWYSPWYYSNWYSPWGYGWYDPWYYGGWYSSGYYGGYYGGGYYGGYYGGGRHHYGNGYTGGYHSNQYTRYARSSSDRATRVSSYSNGRTYSSARSEGSGRVSRGDIISSRSGGQLGTRDESSVRSSSRSVVTRGESSTSSSSQSSGTRTRISSVGPSSSSERQSSGSSSSYSSGSSRSSSSNSNSSSSYSAPSRSSSSSSSSSSSYSSGSSSRSSGSSGGGGSSSGGGGGGSTRSSGGGGGRR